VSVMGVNVSRDVWEHSRASGGALLVLLAIADHADDETREAFPGIKSLAVKTRLSERQVQANIRLLIDLEELSVDYGTGRKHTNTYTVRVKPTSPIPAEKDEAGITHSPKKGEAHLTLLIGKGEVCDIKTPERVKFATERVKPTSPEPSVEPSSTKEPSQDVVDAIADVIVSASFVGDEYETVKSQVAKSLTRVDGFDPRDGPLQADLYVGYYTSGKGKKRQPSNWYTSWLNWMKQAVKYEQRDNQQDQPRLTGGTPSGGGTGGIDPDVQRRGYDYDEWLNAAGR
jgi:hypothetical protein